LNLYLYFSNPIDYTAADAENNLSRFIYGLNIVTGKPNILCAWLAGEGAKKIAEMEDEEVQSLIMQHLEDKIGDSYPNIPQPNDILVRTMSYNCFANLC